MATLYEKLIANPRGVLNAMDQAQIERLIKRLDKAFFTQDELVPDTVYDVIRRYYQKKFPGGSLTSKIGAKAKADQRLDVPMASLNQYQVGTAKLQSALTQGPFVLADKLDGLSVEVVYEKGVPVRAFRRGDAEFGTDISHHIPSMRIPRRLPVDVVIRFEGIIRAQLFADKMHKDVGGDYRAARNAAVGLLGAKESSPHIKNIDMCAFEILRGPGAGQPKSKQFNQLEAWGFRVPEYKVVRSLTEPQLIAYLEKRVKESPYEIDGIVVSRNIAYKHSGASNPKHEFKFKMNAEASMALTKCTGVVYQQSKFGALTPVVQFEPTMLGGGATCSKATGHNGFFITHGCLKDDYTSGMPKKPIGKGAVLKVVRSGSVIPYIVEVVRPARKPDLPTVPYRVDGVNFMAEGDIHKMDSVKVARITDFMTTVGIKDVGDKSIAKLIEEGAVTNLTQLIKADTKKLAPVIGVARARTLVAEIQRVLFLNGVRLELLYRALSPWYIEGMGETNWSKVLPRLPKTVLELASIQPSAVEAAISDVTAVKSLHKDIAKAVPAIAKVIIKMGFIVKSVSTKKTKLTGQVVLMTGFRDSDLKERLLAAGAQVASSFTKTTTLVVASDVNGSSSKLDKARAAGIKVINKEELEKML